MPDVTFHALRHTRAAQLIDAGVDIVTISKRLGHAKPDITLRIYAHPVQKGRQQGRSRHQRRLEPPGCQSGAKFRRLFP